MFSSCPQIWFSTNHHWSSFIHCFWYVWNQLILVIIFYMLGQDFFFSVVNPWPGFLWFFFQHINCLSIALKCFAHQDDSKGHRPEIHFFMKSYFIFLTYLNPLSMLSSLNFFKLGRESKVSYVKHSHFLIIFWPWPFFLLNLIWHQGF